MSDIEDMARPLPSGDLSSDRRQLAIVSCFYRLTAQSNTCRTARSTRPSVNAMDAALRSRVTHTSEAERRQSFGDDLLTRYPGRGAGDRLSQGKLLISDRAARGGLRDPVGDGNAAPI